MAISLTDIQTYMDGLSWKYKSNPKADSKTDGHLVTGFPTETYQDKDGDNYLSIAIAVDENGERIRFMTPALYNCKHPQFRKAFFEVAMSKALSLKLCHFDYDHSDGEIRMINEIPLEDGSFTAKQLERVIRAMVRLADNNHQDLYAAITTGALPMLDYKTDIAHEVSQMSTDDQLELLVEIKKRRRGAQS